LLQLAEIAIQHVSVTDAAKFESRDRGHVAHTVDLSGIPFTI
jgi:hypothetical protein